MAVDVNTLKIHPAADEFPRMDAAHFDDLVDDIRRHGQREPIKLFRGKVLDGRNRLAACRALGIKPHTETLPDDLDPWAYVWSLNGARRDLVAEQRYLIWKHVSEQSEAWKAERNRIRDEANRKRSETQKGKTGEPAETECCRTSTHPEAKAKATASKTNPGAVQRGDRLAREYPDLAADVRSGKLKPSEAHRQAKKREVSQKVADFPDGQYRVIYADPPWSYSDGRTGDGMTATGALHHYPTMSLAELKALDVAGIAAPDSVLFLWATSPLLPDALELASAWGFRYRACFIWDKVKHNLGHYNSVRHEFLLICTRGSCTPDASMLLDSVQVIEKSREHSRKPEEFRALIDLLYPHGPRIELFRRGDTPDGWHVWGNEAVA